MSEAVIWDGVEGAVSGVELIPEWEKFSDFYAKFVSQTIPDDSSRFQPKSKSESIPESIPPILIPGTDSGGVDPQSYINVMTLQDCHVISVIITVMTFV